MLNFFRNLRKTQQKTKTIKEQVSSIGLGNYVVLDLNPDICTQLRRNNSARYDDAVLNKCQLKGLVKAVYVADNTNIRYIEVVGLVVSGDLATRREYVVMEGEIQKLCIVAI